MAAISSAITSTAAMASTVSHHLSDCAYLRWRSPQNNDGDASLILDYNNACNASAPHDLLAPAHIRHRGCSGRYTESASLLPPSSPIGPSDLSDLYRLPHPPHLPGINFTSDTIMTKVWNAEGELPLRRYGPRAPGYNSISHDRYRHNTQPEGLRNATRSYVVSTTHESQRNELDPEKDDKASRKRIPVACGRCRKRKIRCSGPQGEKSCSNCKNAGNSDCQFNRVQSEEFIFDRSVEFGYNTELARIVHCRGGSQAGPYRPQTPSYTYGPNVMPPNISLSCRTHSSDYQYQPKLPSYLPSFSGDYGDDPLDYTLSGSTYPLYGSENVGVPPSYASHGTSRLWVPGTQPAKDPANSVYFDHDAASYGPSQMPYNSQPWGIRSPVSSEPNHFSFSSLASSLPTTSPIGGNDRSLPAPARINSALAPVHRSADDLNYSGTAMKAVGGHTLAASQLTGGHSTSLNYLLHSSNPDTTDSYNSNSLAGSLSHQQPNLYSSSDNWNPTAVTADPALRSQESPPEIYYSNSGGGSRKTSQDSQSSVRGSLGNHLYQTPYHREKPQIPGDNPVDMSHRATRRPSKGGLRAA